MIPQPNPQYCGAPDADRLAVATKHAGEWRIFSGNEIGALLGWYCWLRYSQQNPAADRRGFLPFLPRSLPCAFAIIKERVFVFLMSGKLAMLSSSVSSMVLRAIAAKEGFHVCFGFFWRGFYYRHYHQYYCPKPRSR